MATTTAGNIRHDREARSLATAWGLPVLLGVVLIAAGILALSSTVVAGLATVVMLGALLVIGGVFEIGAALRHGRERRPWLTGVAGALSVAAGVLLIAYPGRGLATTTLMLGTFLVGAGIFRIITSMLDRYPRWGFDLAYGVATALLGSYVLTTWPVSSLFIVGTLVGVELIFRGGAWLGTGAAIRRALQRGGDLYEGDLRGGLAHG